MTKFQFARIAVAVAVASAFSSGALAGDTASVAVSATVTGVCKSNGGSPSLAFTLDPATGGAVAATVVQPSFWCTKGTTWTLTDDGGLHNSSGRRMQHASVATEFIPYTMTYTSTGTGAGKATPITVTLAGSVAQADYINAQAGNYSDTVVLTIAP